MRAGDAVDAARLVPPCLRSLSAGQAQTTMKPPRKIQLVECAFMIPLVRNSDRVPHSPATWASFEAELDATFPQGSTGPEVVQRLTAPVAGRYRDRAGRWILDQSFRYYLAIPRSRLKVLEGAR